MGRTRPGRSSLFVRIFALVLATVVVAQLINLGLLVLIPPDPPRTQPLAAVVEAARVRDTGYFRMRIVDGPLLRDPADGRAADLLEAEIATGLGRAVADVHLDLAPIQNGKLVYIFVGDEPMPALHGVFRLALREADGRWRLMEPRDRRRLESRERQLLLLFLLSAIVMLPIAWLFARRMARPFAQFADAAERLGRDPQAQPPDIEGPAEVERTSAAFREMQARLAAYVADRLQMVGAIAHDLRTPLTRLAFRVDGLKAPGAEAIAADVAEMEAMVAATLNYVRTAAEPGERQRIELGSLVERVAEDLALTGRAVSAEAEDAPLIIDGDLIGLRRMVTNLLDNGEKFGGRAQARIWRDGAQAVLEIVDDGPGLPTAELERVFEPFHRVEPSRSRETGGIGLGLSVVRSIVLAHGGTVTLGNRAPNGLVVRVMLPLFRPS